MAGDQLTVRASAPTRMCDNGGWTDTWFAGHGTVFNIAIEPRVHVRIVTHPRDHAAPAVVIDARSFGDHYAPTGIDTGEWGRHPLLEATIAEIGVSPDVALEISIESAAPSGASIGTSASACVALVGALDALTPGRMTSAEVARAAWRVETERLGQQSGVQDQIAAAFGGVNLIAIDHYPDTTVTRVELAPPIVAELERRLLLVYLGAPHHSSTIHERVIAELTSSGHATSRLQPLRETAQASVDALVAGDLEAFGRVMTANTESQRRLHAGLVSPLADQVIAAAVRHGALGYKVNGAGGDGGTITLLTDDDPATTARTIDAIAAIDERCAILPFRIAADGLLVDTDQR